MTQFCVVHFEAGLLYVSLQHLWLPGWLAINHSHFAAPVICW
jgi:hypothetical protein